LALPQMAVDLNQTTTNMQWVLSAYMIAVGATMIPAGRLGDLRGHRRIVLAGLVVFGGRR
jgi:MFS family permease